MAGEFKPGDTVMVDADITSGTLVLSTADATVVTERAGRRDARSRSGDEPEAVGAGSPLDLPPTRPKGDGGLVN